MACVVCARYNAGMASHRLKPFSTRRMERAVEKVRARLLRVAKALEKGGIPYAIVGGNAVAAWVARVDAAAVRNTQDVDVLLRRCDLETAAAELAAAGFVRRRLGSLEVFLDGPAVSARDAVHVVFAEEKINAGDAWPMPAVTDTVGKGPWKVVTLDALVRMKLIAFRDKDRVHLRDLIGVGLVDARWCARLPDDLAVRLRQVLATPDG